MTTTSSQVTDPGTPTLYYLMNFNDFGSSLVVLYQQMIVNNWYVVCDMLGAVLGYKSLVRWFFISFYVNVVLILLNIMIAIVLEIHDSLATEVKVKFSKYEMQTKLYRMLMDEDKEAMRRKIEQAALVIRDLQSRMADKEENQ